MNDDLLIAEPEAVGSLESPDMVGRDVLEWLDTLAIFSQKIPRSRHRTLRRHPNRLQMLKVS